LAAAHSPGALFRDAKEFEAGFKHIPIVAGFERFGDALLDQQQGDPILAIERQSRAQAFYTGFR
jgi:hypothetical protein